MTKNMEIVIQQIKTFVDMKYESKLPTVDQINEVADQFRTALASVGSVTVTDDEFMQIKKELPSRIIHSIGYASTLRTRDEGNHVKGWYLATENDHFFWNRYKKYLMTKWSKEQVIRLNDTTDGIMDDLGDPNSDSAFQRRGLLLGDVQSGKTATYTAICNKAADCGYRVIIVLAGLMENLRIQTQKRLDAEFVGLDSKYSFDKKADISLKNVPVGVGMIPPFDSNRHITRFTSATTDFQKKVVVANGLNLNDLNGTALFVVKKHKSILNNLQAWLTKDESILDLPMLLIDDECDNASVNTNKKDGVKKPKKERTEEEDLIDETNRTAINKAINKLLRSFKQATYLGITATPFANIFIQDENAADGANSDLYPRDFLTLLPPPDQYIGVDKIFGRGDLDDEDKDRVEGEFGDTLIPIEDKEQEEFFYYKHKKDIADSLTDIPPSLKDAIRYFVLVTAECDRRYDTTEHRSMLINVSRYTSVQNRLRDVVESYLYDLKADIEGYAQMPAEQAEKIASIYDLKKTWEAHQLERLSDITWEELLSKYLTRAAKRIVVRVVNQSTGANSLDYYNYKGKGMRVIAIGGNSLSRGLTLEGLIVSYFYRNTAMYDTLLQMGRWFGYRLNYDDLFRIWMGEQTISWYGFITDAYNELKQEFRDMARQNLTPADFGFKVRSNPGTLMITARNKMREGKPVSVLIELTGHMIETPRLWEDVGRIEENNHLCLKILKAIDCLPDVKFELAYNKVLMWHDVPKQYIIELVRQYQCHPWNLNFQPVAVSDFIENNDGLDSWDLAIPSGTWEGKYKVELNGRSIEVNPEPRPIERSSSFKKMLTVNSHHVRIGAGGCAKIGLTQDQIKEAKGGNNSATDSKYLAVKGRKPLALIHILHNTMADKLEGYPEEIFALGLGFPGSKSTKKANYVVTAKELENYIDTADLEDADNDI